MASMLSARLTSTCRDPVAVSNRNGPRLRNGETTSARSALLPNGHPLARRKWLTPRDFDGETLIFAGPERGFTAAKLAVQDGKISMQELWKNADNSVQFNTPVLKDGLLYGLSTANNAFCVDAKSGATAWSAPLAPSAGGAATSGMSANPPYPVP